MFIVAGGLAISTPAEVQPQGVQSGIGQIRSLVSRGDSAAARRLADSMATAPSAQPNDQAEALYWRGLLAPVAKEGRVDLARVAVEYPLSPVAADALYRLAHLDLAAGDRANAQRQLARAHATYNGGSTGGDAAFELGQMLLADGSVREGCAALDSGLARTPVDQIEKRNRMAYVRRPCERLVAEPPPDSVVTTPPGPAPEKGRGQRGAASGRTSNRGRTWSAQVGAFALKPEAEKVVSRLAAHGYEARVTDEKPFRVRIGRFADRADAVALIAKLKGEKTPAILVEAERP